MVNSQDSDVKHESNSFTNEFSDTFPLDIRYPSFADVDASGEPMLILSCHEILKEEDVVLC